MVDRDERDTAKFLSEDDVKGAKVLPPIHTAYIYSYIYLSIFLSLSLSLSLYIYMCVYVNVCIYPSIHMYTYERDTAKYLSEDDVKGAKVLPPISTRFELSLDVLSLRSDIMSSK